MAYQFSKSAPMHYRRSSPKNGKIAEVTVKENGLVVDFMTFKTDREFSTVLGKLNKYGWGKESDKEVSNEIKELNDFYKRGV